MQNNIIDFSNYPINILGNIISEAEKQKFLNYYSHLQDINNCELIYRGDNKEKQFKLHHCSDITSYCHSLFLIGNKGRGFIESLEKHYTSKIKWKLDEVNSNIFNEIFYLINDILKKDDLTVQNFTKNNKHIFEYFIEVKNLKHFVWTLQVQSDETKIKIRDYYLTLIHQFEDEYFYPISTLLSVSTNFIVASNFAAKNDNKIIFVGWLPKKRLSNTYAITYDYLNVVKNELVEINLPIYTKSFYPNESEISLKGGLLPHYTVGFIHNDWEGKSIFELNPNFFRINDKSVDWVERGLPIDQSGFWTVLRNTNFSGAFFVNSSGKYSNIEI